jgi:hypothetical protein
MSINVSSMLPFLVDGLDYIEAPIMTIYVCLTSISTGVILTVRPSVGWDMFGTLSSRFYLYLSQMLT